MSLSFKSEFLISNGAKNLDSKLCESILSDLSSMGLEQSDTYTPFDKTSLSLPSIGIYASDEFSAIESISSEDFVLTITSHNTNFFENMNESQNATLSLNDQSDWDRVKTQIIKILTHWNEARTNQVKSIAIENLKKISKRNLKATTPLSIQEFERSLAGFNQRKDLFSSIASIVQECFNEKITVIELKGIALSDLDTIYPFGITNSQSFIQCSKDLEYIAKIIYNYTYFISPRFDESRNGQVELIDGSFLLQKIPFPVALIDKNQELLLHNSRFLNLNISVKQCLAFEDNAQIEINNLPYKVHCKFIGNDTRSKLYYFYPLEDLFSKDYRPSNEEMGIVSSSIAHELNNPLAGILAAIEVILLDEMQDDVVSSLNDMKEGVIRCKELVETFLGFSRATPHQNFEDINIYNSFKQAIELLRFRLIENKINLILNHDIDVKYEPKVNPHVLVMIYYILLGDLLTNYTHRNLVTNSQSSSIMIEFIEREFGFSMKTPPFFGLDNDYIPSKLLKHLMETQGLNLKFSPEEIIFIYK